MPAYTETHRITLTKLAKRTLREKVINSNLSSLLASINTRALLVRGWNIEAYNSEVRTYVDYYGDKVIRNRNQFWSQVDAPYETDADYLFSMFLVVNYTSQNGKHPEPAEFGGILRTIATRVQQPNFGKWQLAEVDGEPYAPSADDSEANSADLIGYAPVVIPEDWDSNFEHLYGLDGQITMVKRALEAGIISDWTQRFNCVLVGPPGCGKSDICQSIKRALGEDAVLEFDATATTAAGAIKELSEREILPRVLLVEEIEKADEKAMSFLLSVLDLRGQIRKTTARNTIVRDTKLFAIATVNDDALFEKLQAGALASRFNNTVWFKRPGREQLAKILSREIARVDGDEDWIEPTLDYCEENNITDPRRVTAICLCGRDMLISGEYQKLLSATAKPREGE